MATLLVLDKNAPRRGFAALILERQGYRTLEAATEEAAIEHLKRESIDLLLLDTLIPPTNGYGFIQRLAKQNSQDKKSRPARVIFLAAPYLKREARELAHACGVFRIITDVTRSEALIANVQDALKEPPIRPENLPSAQIDASLHRVIERLHGRVLQLEADNARLERRSILGQARLEAARFALDDEIDKRLISEDAMKREYQHLQMLSVRDPLTGLYNRRYLEESLEREESRARRSGSPMSVMMIDIDHFKRCNDTYGHAAGDTVLRAVSRCMAEHARSEDILCRYGGEEFVIVMTNTALETLRERANSLRHDVPQLNIEYDHHHIGPITLSIGIANYPASGNSAQAVLHAADIALYEAKHNGRNRVELGVTH